MVGKGDSKSSRIFHQCYLKCCKLQNLTPLNNVIPSVNGKVLDFCVDRIKYVDWPPILNALSCDLSLHSLAIRCRQQVKTVLEQIDCERLAKTVNKRAVILTKFMLSNLIEAVAQMLTDSTLLTSVLLEGLPIRIPYLNPICDALLNNNSLSHVALPRCLIGDAGCLALCKAVRCLPNILSLDLSGCELTILGASYIADLIKYQKIHRYSENWVHTLRYRLPELDTMAGLRRISLGGNPLGDAGAATLLAVLADDLWIKAVDLQNCDLTELTTQNALQTMQSNTTLVVLDLRHNADICGESLSKIRAALRKNEQGIGEQYPWLGSSSTCPAEGVRVAKPISRNGVKQDRVLNQRNAPMKYTSNKTTVTKRDKEYAEELELQLQEEISHRQQLEELNVQLVEQLKQLKQQQIRLWAENAASSGSEQSFAASSTGEHSASSSSSCSVPIDQNTLSYIQQAFRDIYAFIKNNQCTGNCQHEAANERAVDQIPELIEEEKTEEIESELRVNIIPKKAQSTHLKLTENIKVNKITKSAHLLGHIQHIRDTMQMKPEMIEKQMGDTKSKHNIEEHYIEELNESRDSSIKKKKGSTLSRSSESLVSDSSDTLVSPHHIRNKTKATKSRDSRASLRARGSRDALDSRASLRSRDSRTAIHSRASLRSRDSRDALGSRASLNSQGSQGSSSSQGSASPPHAPNPRDALYSSSDEESS